MTAAKPESRALCLQGQEVTLRSATRTIWMVPLSEVGVVGEYTTDGGPMLDDWFLVFVRHDGNWLEAPADLPGAEVVIDQLRSVLHASFALGLANSTRFASRVIWPSSLEDRPLFSFSPTTP